MKKLFSTLWMALLVLSVCGVTAYADIIVPPEPGPVGGGGASPLPWLLLGLAVIAAAVLIWLTRKRKR